MIRTARARCFSFLLLATACGGDDGGAPSGVERTDSAGVAVIANRGPDRVLEWTLEPEVRVGDVEGPQAFARIHDGSVGADAEGNLYVLDTQAQRVLVFDRSGAFVREMGRKGGGPGEFQWPQYLAVADDGSVAVLDFGKGLVRFDPEGRPLTEVRFAGGGPSEIALGPFGVAGVLDRMAEARDTSTSELTLMGASDTTVLARLRVPVVTDVSFPDCPVRISGMPAVLAPEIVWAVAGERILAAAGPEYAVDLYDPSGALVGSVRRDLQPQPTTIELAAREVGDSMRIQFGGGRCAIPPEDVVEARGYAPRVPLVRRLAGAPDGSFWVGRGVGVGRDGTWTIDVFAPDGEYLGTLPDGTPFPAAFRSADEALVVERDELDVPSLVVYRVRRGRSLG